MTLYELKAAIEAEQSRASKLRKESELAGKRADYTARALHCKACEDPCCGPAPEYADIVA